MTIKVSRVFNGFFLAAFEAGGNRPQPQGLRASASRYYIKARRLGIKPGGVAHGASNEASGFSRFLSNILGSFHPTHQNQTNKKRRASMPAAFAYQYFALKIRREGRPLRHLLQLRAAVRQRERQAAGAAVHKPEAGAQLRERRLRRWGQRAPRAKRGYRCTSGR